MAIYTLSLKEMVDYYTKETEGIPYSLRIEQAASDIIPFDYPCYGQTPEEMEANRVSLNIAIVRHYLMREIGYETPLLWELMLEERLKLIMPKYQELYKTTLFTLDLDNPYHMVTTHDQTAKDNRDITKDGTNSGTQTGKITTEYDIQDNGTQNTDGSASGTEDMTHSDMPQVSYQNGDYVTYQEQRETGSKSETSGSTTNKRTGDQTENRDTQDSESYSEGVKDINDQIMHYLHDVKGHGSNMEVLEAIAKWRELIVNIQNMIIEEISDLFMQIYSY